MDLASLRPVFAAELIKLRTVRSSVWTLGSTIVVGAGFGYLLGLAWRSGADEIDDFDPLFPTFYGIAFAQFAVVVFGVLAISGEYSSGTIRSSLTAVPRRGVLYTGKLLAVALPVLAVSVITVLVTFAAAHTALGDLGVPIGEGDAPGAAVGACLYLVLICLFAMGVATMLRSAAATLGILMPVFFLGSQGLGNVPKVKTVAQYLPDQAGMLIMHLVGPQHDERWTRDYGPWTGLAIMALWTAAALLGGYLVMRRRDA